MYKAKIKKEGKVVWELECDEHQLFLDSLQEALIEYGIKEPYTELVTNTKLK